MTKKQINRHFQKFYGYYKAHEVLAVQSYSIDLGHKIGLELIDYNGEAQYLEVDILMPLRKIIAIYVTINNRYTDIMKVNASAKSYK